MPPNQNSEAQLNNVFLKNCIAKLKKEKNPNYKNFRFGLASNGFTYNCFKNLQSLTI